MHLQDGRVRLQYSLNFDKELSVEVLNKKFSAMGLFSEFDLNNILDRFEWEKLHRYGIRGTTFNIIESYNSHNNR